VIALHGWGLSSATWEGWASAWAPEARVQLFERGYFASPREVSWPSEVTRSAEEARSSEAAHSGGRAEPGPSSVPPPGPSRVLLIHSMGILFASPELLAGADLLVLLASFPHFHPASEREGARSRRLLGRMRRRFPADPGGVLREFRHRCDLPEVDKEVTLERVGFDAARLAGDLDLLETGRAQLPESRRRPALCLLYGTHDQIVPLPSRPGEEWGLPLASERVHLALIPGAGHGLPLTHPEACLAQVERAVSEFWP